MTLVGWVRVLHYHDSMAQSPKMMKAIVARIAIGLAARMRLARSPDVDACHHAKNTPPCLSNPGAPRGTSANLH